MQEKLIILAAAIITIVITTIYELVMYFLYKDFELRNILGNTLFAIALAALFVYGIYPAIK